jgi:succinate dehydrogenase / fumarate reductase, cytochrome b subunit
MNPLNRLLSSTIGLKFAMALSGMLLVGFVIAHLIGNLQIFLGPEPLNRYAEFLKSIPELLWIARAVLLAALVVHVLSALKLKFTNMSARPEGYAYTDTVQASLASRTMLLTGVIILIYIFGHLAHFTLGLILPEFFKLAKEQHDVYAMVVRGFQNRAVSAAYIAAMIAAGFHLNHGIASMFQTLGLNHPQYTPIINRVGPALGVLIALGYISIPVAALTGLISTSAGAF